MAISDEAQIVLMGWSIRAATRWDFLYPFPWVSMSTAEKVEQPCLATLQNIIPLSHARRLRNSGDVQWGDLIVAVEGKPVETVDELLTALEKHSVGDQVKLTVIRGLGTNQEQTLELALTLAAETAE